MSRLILAVALVAGTAAIAFPSAAAQQQSPAAAVAQALDSVRSARTARDPQVQVEGLAAALRILNATPDLSASIWLKEPLSANPPDAERAEQRLAATLDLLSGERRQSDPASDRLRLGQILGRPQFQTFDWMSLVPGWVLPAVEVVTAILRWVWNVVRWPFDRLFELLAHALTNGPIMLVLALPVLVGVVFLYARGLKGVLVSQAEMAVADLPLPPTAGEALRRAQEEAERGRYREASHYLFASTLLWLEEQGRFRFDPAATNQEHLARVAADAQIADGLRPFVLRFDRVWYGQDEATRRDFEDLSRMAVLLKDAIA